MSQFSAAGLNHSRFQRGEVTSSGFKNMQFGQQLSWSRLSVYRTMAWLERPQTVRTDV